MAAPPIGRALAPDSANVFPGAVGLCRPEPIEFTRYAIAAAIPVLVAIAVLARPGRRRGWIEAAARSVATGATVVVLALVLVAWFARSEPDAGPTNPQNYFSDLDGVLALALAATVFWAAGSNRARVWFGERAEAQWVRIAAWAVALVVTADMLLPALFTEPALHAASRFVSSHLPYYLSDYAAFGNGATPLVDHANHYAHLLPFLLAPALSLFDYSPAALTIVLAALSAAALLLVFRGLALVARSELGGISLYLPALGLILLPIIDDSGGLVFDGNVYSVLPERLLGPFVVFWLCARHLGGCWPRSSVVVTSAAGLAAWNNPEFGVPCLAGAVAALLLASWEPGTPWPAIRRSALQAMAGAVTASALVALITLVRAGSLPDPDLLLYFSRLSGLHGFVLLPMPVVGLWIAVYLSFAGTLVLAAARAASAAPDRMLTGVLAYTATLGLGAGVFYVGRSDKFTMTAVVAVWALNLAALSVWALRGRPATLGALALVGLGLGAAQLLFPPAPWAEIDRLATRGSDIFDPFQLQEQSDFVAARTDAGDQVLILRESSDVIAEDAGVRNVSPVSEPQHVIGPEQLDFVLAALGDAEGAKVFTGDGPFLGLYDGIPQALRKRGWTAIARSPGGNLTEWRRGGVSSRR